MIPFSKSLGFRLLVISFILLALPLLVDSFVLLQERYSRAVTNTERIIKEATQIRELSIADLNPLHRNLVDFFTHYLESQHFLTKKSAELNKKLEDLAQAGELYGIVVIKIEENGDLKTVASNRPEYRTKNFADFFKMQDFHTPEVLNKDYSSYFFRSPGLDEPLFFFAHPIYLGKEHKYTYVILLVSNLQEKLKSYVRSENQLYTINFALLLPSTIVISASDPALLNHYFLPINPYYKELFERQEPQVTLPKKPLKVSRFSNYPFFEFEWKGENQIGYFKSIPEMAYSILSYTSKSAVFQKPLLEFIDIYSTYGIILTIGGFLASFLTMIMVRPMQNLGLCMQHIQEGHLEARYKKDPFGFEINTLGEIFNSMVDEVLEKKRMAEDERVVRETYAKELRLGQQVQRDLLPQHMPDYPNVEVAEAYIPTIEVGGDFYDVFVNKNNRQERLMLMIADVSGKGVGGCLYSLSVRNMLRVHAKFYGDIAEAMHRTNQLFMLDTGESGTFVTALLASYDAATHIFSYYSCGHNPGIVLRKDGQVEWLKNQGVALGAFETEKGEADTVFLRKGDAVIFYTDGVTEAHDENYKNFGEGRLAGCLRSASQMGAQEIVDEIIKQLRLFVGEAQQHDDITLLVMKVKK